LGIILAEDVYLGILIGGGIVGLELGVCGWIGGGVGILGDRTLELRTPG